MNIVGKDNIQSNETFIPYEINELSNIKQDEICRICYSNDNSKENNPMISICKCKGSMNLHLECLKKWIKSKLQIKEINNKPGISYIIQQFKC
jgi:E3 ubiquitin-protein ligase DOA10